MKLKYLPTELPVEHPIIGRWYRIKDGHYIVRPLEIVKYNYIQDQVKTEYVHDYPCQCPVCMIQRVFGFYDRQWFSVEHFNDDTLLPLPLYKRAYHATCRTMAKWIPRWVFRHPKAIH